MKTTVNIFFNSSTFRRIIFGIGIVAGALFIFQAGMIVGMRRAAFGYHWQENYHRNFDGEQRGFLGIGGERLPGAHGTFGRIIRVTLPTFAVEDAMNIEKTVRLGGATIIREPHGTAGPDTLVVGESVIVVGTPNNEGEIEAKLIRILPAPEVLPALEKQ